MEISNICFGTSQSYEVNTINTEHLASLPLELYETIFSNLNNTAIANMASTDKKWNRTAIHIFKNHEFAELICFAKRLSDVIPVHYKKIKQNLLDLITKSDRDDFLSIPMIKKNLKDAECVVRTATVLYSSMYGCNIDNFFDSFIGIKKPQLFYQLASKIPGKYFDLHERLKKEAYTSKEISRVKDLIDQGAFATDITFSGAFRNKCYKKEIVKILLQACAIPTTYTLGESIDFLKDDVSFLKSFLEAGAIPRLSTLSRAITNNCDEKMLNLLFEWGVKPTAESLRCDQRYVNILLNKGAIPDDDSLMYAFYKLFSNQIAMKYLTLGVIPSERSLTYALMYGMYRTQTIEALLDRGDITPTEDHLNTALGVSEKNETIHLLLERGAIPGSASLYLAVQNMFDESIVKILLDKGVRPSADTLELAKRRGEYLEVFKSYL